MSHVDPFNALGGFSVGIPPELVIDETGNVVNNVNAPNSNVTANRIFANAYLYANGDPLSIGASGSNTQVQYNNNGLLGASPAFTFNSATSLLTISKIQVGNTANLGNVSNVVILGGTNGYFLQTDGSGNLTWAPAGNGGGGNGNPGGANTQVQFNNQGNFGGDAGFTYNSTTNLLTVGEISTGNLTADYIVANWDVTANVVFANYLMGDGSNITNVHAIVADVANSVAGSNVTGQVNFAAVANSVAGANVTGQVSFANVANNVAGANISGQVANALVAGTVYTAAQPNITSVGNLTSLTVVGNTTLGNQVVSNYFIGNLFGTANLARYVTFANQPNITNVGTLTSLTVSGNTTLGNSATANYFIGNFYGTANNALTANTANIAGTANTANFANTANLANNTLYSNTANVANVAYSVDGANVVGQVANAAVAGTVTTAAQPNITSVGNLSTLTVVGSMTAGNITSIFIGNGARLTDLPGGNVVGAVANATYATSAGSATVAATATIATTAGTVTTNAQPNIESVGTLTSLTVGGNISAGNISSNFIGNGSKLTNLPAGNIVGTVANATYATNAGTATIANSAITANTANTVTNSAQPNITSVGNLSSLNVSGNINAGTNVLVDDGFVRADYLIGPLATPNQSNITSLGTLTGLTVNGTTNLGNVGNVKITGGTAGYVLSTDGTGNLNWVVQSNGGGNGTPAGINSYVQYNDNGAFGASANFTFNDITRNLFVNGSANANGNITAKIFVSNIADGTAPLQVVSTTPVANLAAATALSVRNAAQPNITSVGTLTSLAVTGNISGGNVQGGNLVSASFVSGTLTTASQPNITSVGTLSSLGVNGNVTAVNITANTGVFAGNGAGLTNITGANVTGQVANANYAAYAGNATNATTATTSVTAGSVLNNAQPNITSLGTLTNLNVTGNVLAGNLNANNVVLTSNGAFFGNGAGLSDLNASNITTGILANTRLNGFYGISVANANIAETVSNAAQPNITSVGTLTSLAVNGTANLGTVGNVKIAGGTSGYVLQTDGLGNLSWTAQTGGNGNATPPGGLNTQIQYNDNGNFAGNSDFTWNNTAKLLTVTGTGSITNINASNISANVANANTLNIAGNATANNISATLLTGTLTTNAQPNVNYLGNLGYLNINTSVPNSNGNITFNGSINGIGTSSDITITGNVNAGNWVQADYLIGTLTVNAQPNITSVGTLTSLAVSGAANLGNVSNVRISGGTNGYVLTTDGTGNLSWTTKGGGGGNGTPGGSNTQIQYNDGGLFNGSPAFTFNESSNVVYIGGNANVFNTLFASNVVATNLDSATLDVTGNITAGNLTGANLVSANYIAGTLTTASQLNINYLGNVGWLNVNTAIPNANGNITFNGTLRGTGAASDIVVTGNVDAGNFVQANYLIGTLTTAAQPNITTVGNLTNLKVDGVSNLGNVANFKLLGGSNGYVLSTDGTGNLTWVEQSGGGGNTTPGGLNTYIQFNDSGNFNGVANFTFNKNSSTLLVGGNANVTNTVRSQIYVSTAANGTPPLAVNSTTPVANLAADTAGTVRNNAQPNITSLGTLTSLTVSGNLNTGNLSVSNTFSAANISTPGTVGATNLNVSGNGSFSGNLTVTGSGNLTVNGKFNTAGSSNVNLGNISNLHIAGGINGYVLSTDGAGNLSWTAGGGGGNGSPGGSNTQVQYNKAGIFGGSSFFTFNESTSNVQIAGNLISNSITLGSGAYEFCSSSVFFATTNSTAPNQVILSIPISGSITAGAVAAVEYTIISTDDSTRNFVKISCVRVGSSLNYVEYSTLPVNGYTGDFSVVYFAGNVSSPASIQLKLTPESANLMTHKMLVTTYYD